MLGLAVGDALGAPAENLTPSQIRERWGRIDGFVRDDPAGTDDTEYAIFSGLLLARHGSQLTVAQVESAWHELIADRDEGPFRGAGFSERGTLENLRRGLAAPISAQHRHAWSDGLAMRAAPFGVFAAGRPAEAARLVAIDGTVSHDGEGIYGGRAVAAGVAAAMVGHEPDVVVQAALSVVPEDSWTARSLHRAVSAARRARHDPAATRLSVERAVRSATVIGGYPWTDLAPEAVGLAFGAFAAARGEFRAAVGTAVNMGRDADTTAAVAGALAGALRGVAAIPPDWSAAIGPVSGSCLPSMAGRHVLEVADLLTPPSPPAEAATTADGGGAATPPAGTATPPAGTATPPAGREERTWTARNGPTTPSPRDAPGGNPAAGPGDRSGGATAAGAGSSAGEGPMTGPGGAVRARRQATAQEGRAGGAPAAGPGAVVAARTPATDRGDAATPPAGPEPTTTHGTGPADGRGDAASAGRAGEPSRTAGREPTALGPDDRAGNEPGAAGEAPSTGPGDAVRARRQATVPEGPAGGATAVGVGPVAVLVVAGEFGRGRGAGPHVPPGKGVGGVR
nr:ADP-ribosylglycohydrolase family protein [Streptomyces sp. NBRC 109706]